MTVLQTGFLERVEPLSKFRGRRVTVMGLGLFGGGKGVTQFLCRQGAEVTVTDRRGRDILAPIVDELADLPVRWVLGEHRAEDFTGADLVIPSPAVPRDAPLLEECRRRGVPLETEMNLFFKHCRGRICGVTGTNGKTTTTSLTAKVLSDCWPSTRVGGNIGKSLLPEVESIEPDAWVVLELSSFQLEDLASIGRRPEIGVVTNVSPNHLDRHGTYAAYLAAKRTILAPAPSPNAAVLNAEDARLRSWAETDRRTVWFGRRGSARPRATGVWAAEETGVVEFVEDGRVTRVFERSDLVLPGRINLMNASAAVAASLCAGVPAAGVARSLREFRTVEHRLEPFHQEDGIRWYNDSIATTPESVLAAIQALGPNLVLVCGGSAASGRSWGPLGRAIARRVRCAVLIGETAATIDAHIPRVPGGCEVVRADSLDEAIACARSRARPGDHVALSPACASYDMFVNFEERGRRFKAAVQAGAPVR